MGSALGGTGIPSPFSLLTGTGDPLGIFGKKTDIIGRELPSEASAPATTLMQAAGELNQPTPMPLADDDAVKRRRRRSTAEQRARAGRASTIMTEGQGLGG